MPPRRLLILRSLLLLLALALVGLAGVYAPAFAIAVADPNDVPWEVAVDRGISLASGINAGLLILLAITAGLWTRPIESVASDDPTRPKMPRHFPLAVAGALLVIAGFYGWSSFGAKSLWWDEVWQMKQASHGTWKPDKKQPEELRFSPTSWKRCAFYYQKPTNHVPMALAQKASLGLWRTLTGREPHEFTELAARAPALLASAIAVLLLIRVLGLGGGCTLMAVMLLLHPWHLKYGVEARAYAFIVPLSLSAVLAARRLAVDQGRSVWAWVWLAANQALWIWAYPNAVVEVFTFFIVLGVMLWRSAETARDRWTLLLRHLVAHVCAGMVWLQLFLPNLLQAVQWAGKEDHPHYLDAGLMADTLASLTFGMTWPVPASNVESQGLTSLVAVCGGSAPLAAVAVLVALGLSLFGLIRTVLWRPKLGWLLLCPVIGSVCYALLVYSVKLYFYPRFVISLLPVFVAGLGLAIPGLTLWAQRYRHYAIAMLIPFLLIVKPQHKVLRTRPYTPLREVAEFVAGWNPQRPPLSLCYGLGNEAMLLYSPAMIPTYKAADIITARDKAKAEGRDFLVVEGYDSFNRDRVPEGMKLLDDPAQFVEVKAFAGIESDFYFRIYKAK